MARLLRHVEGAGPGTGGGAACGELRRPRSVSARRGTRFRPAAHRRAAILRIQLPGLLEAPLSPRDPSVKDGLARSGIKVKELAPYDWHTGSMQIVRRDREIGRLHGVTDPRRLDYAAGF